MPFNLKGRKVDARVTSRIVEIFHNGKRVASHVRDNSKGKYTTNAEHMPKSHREHQEWTPSRIIQWAVKIGPNCEAVAEHIIQNRQHPQQGYRACLGIIRLSKSYEHPRVEAACRRALILDVCSYRSIQSILKTGKDREPLYDDASTTTCNTSHHQNVRGSDYYAERPAEAEKGGM